MIDAGADDEDAGVWCCQVADAEQDGGVGRADRCTGPPVVV